jgi:hypothetical protein
MSLSFPKIGSSGAIVGDPSRGPLTLDPLFCNEMLCRG